MENDFNVDIVNNETGEVYAESLLLEKAHIKVAENGWKHVETTSEEMPGDGCGGGEGPFVLYTLWVKDPAETAEDTFFNEGVKAREASKQKALRTPSVHLDLVQCSEV